MHRHFYKYLLSFCFLLLTISVTGQQDCERNLEKARVLFEKGYLEDIPELLEPCVDGNYSWANRTTALKLLTETYLFIGNEEKAEEYFANILKMEPTYEPQKNSDHPELVYLSEKFSTKPFFAFGAKIGYNFPSVVNRKTYFLQDSISSTTDVYKGISKLQFGVFGDFNINHSNFDVSAELLFTNIGYSIETDMVFNEPNILGTLTFEEHLKFIDLGANLRYNFKPLNFPIKPKNYTSPIKTIFYLSAGFALDFLYYDQMENLNFSKIDVANGITFIEKQQLTGMDLIAETPSIRNTLNYSYNAAAGVKIRFAKAFWVFDFRYNGMINNIVNSENRYSNDELIQRFRHVDNDIAFNSFVISFGFGFTLSYSVKKIKS